MYQEYLDVLLEYMRKPEVLYTLGGILIVYALYRMIRSSFKAIHLYNNDSGHIQVTRSALLKLIYSTCEQNGCTTKPSVGLHIKRGKLHVELRIKISSTQRLNNFSSQIQKSLTEAFHDTLGYDRIGSINVTVTGIKTNKPASKHSGSLQYAAKESGEGSSIHEVLEGLEETSTESSKS